MAKWTTDEGEQTPESLAASMVSHPEQTPKTGKAKKTAKPNGQVKAQTEESAQTSEAEQPKTKAAKKERPVRICQSKKKNGQPCTAHVMADADGNPTEWCTDHRPAWMHLTDEEMAKVEAVVDGMDSARFVRLMGWGQVREAIRKGKL